MRFFSYDNPVWRFVLRVGQIWWLHILWLVTSIPLVTIGASTTALIYSCMKLQKEDGYPLENFFRSFRENFLQATAIWLIYVGAGCLLGFGLVFWNQTDPSSIKLGWALVIALAIPYVFSLLYVFAVQAKFVNKVKDTIHYAIILSVKYFRYTFQMLLLAAFMVYVNLNTIVWANFLTLTIGFGLAVYLCSFYYQKIFENYIPMN
ncbi:MAG: YesL family protein [Blautia sp.]|nr:YesL family protein [Blautia sp.]